MSIERKTSRDMRHDIEPSKTVAKLLQEYTEIEATAYDGLRGDDCAFVIMEHEDGAQFPDLLARIAYDGRVAFIVPRGFDHERSTTRLNEEGFVEHGDAFVPKNTGDWPSDDELNAALGAYTLACNRVRWDRGRQERLESYRCWDRSPLATVRGIAAEAPQIVSGFMPDGAVSVIYGKWDEFKTTLVYDLAGSVALGTKFQGFEIALPRPVVIYALEGADAATPRLRAVEAKLRRHNPLWGDFPMPVAVRDRIPETDVAWRKELSELSGQMRQIYRDRWPDRLGYDPSNPSYQMPDDFETGTNSLVIVDTLSMAIGGSETGEPAVDFIKRCLDLLKHRPEFEVPYDGDTGEWQKHPVLGDPNAEDFRFIDEPVASAVIIVHHPTKSGDDFGGHRAIAANTQALYRVHRFGSMSDPARPMKGIITPLRTKDMARPAPLRFEVEVVPVPGADKRTTVVLKETAPDVPAKLKPVAAALASVEADSAGVLSPADVQACIDRVAKNRASRGRYRDQLIEAGILEPVHDDADKLTGYRFHGSA